jgi:hypothetical protein
MNTNELNSYNTAGLQCPNLSDNRMMIKLVEPGRLGVVLGPRLMGCLCLKGYFELIDRFYTTTITIRSGETQKLELGNTADYGYRRETWKFDIADAITSSQNVTAYLSIPSGNETINFMSGTSVSLFVQNLRAQLNASTFLKANFEVSESDKDNKTFTFRTIKNGLPMTCVFNIGTEPIVGTQLFDSIRYPRGRCRFIFVLADYDEFTEPIPASNKKHFLYAFDQNYIDNYLFTPENIEWRHTGKIYADSSDKDLAETDTNLIETIWLNNPMDYDISMQVMIAS